MHSKSGSFITCVFGIVLRSADSTHTLLHYEAKASLLHARVGIFFSDKILVNSRRGKTTGQCGVRHGGDNILLRQKSFFSTQKSRNILDLSWINLNFLVFLLFLSVFEKVIIEKRTLFVIIFKPVLCLFWFRTWIWKGHFSDLVCHFALKTPYKILTANNLRWVFFVWYTYSIVKCLVMYGKVWIGLDRFG